MLFSKSLRFPLILSILILVYVSFFLTDKFETVSMIKIKDNETGIELNLLGALSSNNSEIYEVEKYLKSDEAKDILIKVIENNIGSNSLESGFFDLVNNQYFRSDREYISFFYTLDIEDSSGILTLKTFGYDPETSFVLNNYLIFLTQNYFDRKQMVVNSIKSTNSLCNLSKRFTNEKNISDADYIEAFSKEIVSDSSNNPLFTYSERIREDCLDGLSESAFIDTSENFNFLPSEIKSKQSAVIYEQLVSGIIDSEETKGFLSDKLIMISNPILPYDSVKKRALLISFVTFISFILLGFALRVLVSVFRTVE